MKFYTQSHKHYCGIVIAKVQAEVRQRVLRLFKRHGLLSPDITEVITQGDNEDEALKQDIADFKRDLKNLEYRITIELGTMLTFEVGAAGAMAKLYVRLRRLMLCQ